MPQVKSKKVSIIMGSQSDFKTMVFCQKVLKKLNIKYETKIISAHRTPKRMYEYAKSAETAEIAERHAASIKENVVFSTTRTINGIIIISTTTTTTTIFLTPRHWHPVHVPSRPSNGERGERDFGCDN